MIPAYKLNEKMGHVLCLKCNQKILITIADFLHKRITCPKCFELIKIQKRR